MQRRCGLLGAWDVDGHAPGYTLAFARAAGEDSGPGRSSRSGVSVQCIAGVTRWDGVV